MKLGVFWKVVIVGGFALAPLFACSSKVENCSELGTDWVACGGAGPLLCVSKGATGQCRAANRALPDGTVTPDASTTDSGGQGTCPSRLDTACSTGCTNLDTDEKNCGKCGVECSPNQNCVFGECQ
jgi:hypothetical protein